MGRIVGSKTYVGNSKAERSAPAKPRIFAKPAPAPAAPAAKRNPSPGAGRAKARPSTSNKKAVRSAKPEQRRSKGIAKPEPRLDTDFGTILFDLMREQLAQAQLRPGSHVDKSRQDYPMARRPVGRALAAPSYDGYGEARPAYASYLRVPLTLHPTELQAPFTPTIYPLPRDWGMA